MNRAIKERLYGWSSVVVRRVMLRLSRRAALRVGAAIGQLAFWIARGERKRAYSNLRSSLHDKTPKELKSILRHCFRNFGKSLVEVMRFPQLTPDVVNQIVTYEGREHLDAALAEGRGVVLVTAHLGNWELLGAALALNGYPLMVIARTLRSERLNALLCAHRRQVGMQILFRGESMIRGLRFLKRGGILAILADVDTRTPGVFVKFFGRSAYTPYGPVAIALKTSAVLLPVFIVRMADDSHQVLVKKPLELVRTGSWESDVVTNTQCFTSLIESMIRAYPDQWIWTHQRWKTQT